MNLGAFLVVIAIQSSLGFEDISEDRGLAYRSPYLAVIMAIFFFSLTGIPPFAGFIGKVYLFAGILAKGSTLMYLLAMVGIVNTVISLYFYVRVVRAMFIDRPGEVALVRAPELYRWTLAVLVAPILVLGLYWTPQPDPGHERRGVGGMGSRRKARECAVQILYQMDVSGQTAAEALAAYWQSFEHAEELAEFTGDLVHGVGARLAEVDRLIQDSSRHWKIERMARVDRNILRLAVYELLYHPEIPKRVTLNEAIEIGKRFGSEDSSAFIKPERPTSSTTAR
jgi:transcription antitermination factor NusB